MEDQSPNNQALNEQIQTVTLTNRVMAFANSPLGTTAIYLMGQGLRVLLLVAVTIITYKVFFEPRVVTVDLNKIVTAEIASAQARGQSEDQRAANAERFGQALEAALTSASEGGRNIVMVSPAVVRGGEDRTAAISEKIQSMMGLKK